LLKIFFGQRHFPIEHPASRIPYPVSRTTHPQNHLYLRPMSTLGKIWKQLTGKTDVVSSSAHSTSPSPDEIQSYTAIIASYISFFNALDIASRQRFVLRTWEFRQLKRFHYVGINEIKEMPVLVSAAAVQLSFGLANYRLDFFKDIHIIADAYDYANNGQLYVGHVEQTGIYLSWKHFLQGYADATDNLNVAIHEMAHAVYYDNFMDNAGLDPGFRSRFAKLSPVFGPALAGLLISRRSYLRPYAYSNIQEFWAVGVEAFFENPAGLRDTMPALYNVIAEILKLDPASAITEANR
jgi:MtfA peptidase